jgi:hypothetical protein
MRTIVAPAFVHNDRGTLTYISPLGTTQDFANEIDAIRFIHENKIHKKYGTIYKQEVVDGHTRYVPFVLDNLEVDLQEELQEEQALLATGDDTDLDHVDELAEHPERLESLS